MKISVELNACSLLRWLIALLLIWAAVGKLANLQEFYGSLLAYKLPLPGLVLREVAAVLPWLELICGLLLVANLRPGAATLWALTLFAVFTIATGQAWLRGLHISCGCLDLRLFGLDREGGLAKLLESASFACLRAAVLTAVAFHLLRTELRRAPTLAGSSS